MIKYCCNICTKELKGVPKLPFCERCTPFAEEYTKGLAEVIQTNAEHNERQMNSYRNAFFREKVRAKLEAVK